MGKKASTLPTGQSQYQVVGRFVPNAKYPEDNAQCKVYRMNLFAKNKVVARSRFCYFMGRRCRVKKANGQIISVSQVRWQMQPHFEIGERTWLPTGGCADGAMAGELPHARCGRCRAAASPRGLRARARDGCSLSLRAAAAHTAVHTPTPRTGL